MAKQEKVLKKIQGALKHGNEGQLGVKKNDECYTDAQDILNELSYWADLGKFQGKSIICPCDWDITDDEDICGITITYKEEGIEVVSNNIYKAVKRVYVDLWHGFEEPFTIEHIDLAEDEIEDFLRDKLTCNFLRVLTQNARRWGIKTIAASGYNPANGKGTKFQEVDYSKYDVCITNPPFSLYSEFMATIVGNIDFIVLAPFLNRANPCIATYLMSEEAYLGYGIHLNLAFNNPTKERQYHIKHVACDWITSYPEAQQERDDKHYKSGVKYSDYKTEYVELPNMTMKDGTHPIRVSTSVYPEDYEGWMFGSVSVLDNLNQNEYEWYCTGCKKYFNQSCPEKNPFVHRVSNEMLDLSTGKRNFHGIVFRKKQN